jgi:hypothetical protein
MDTRRATVTIKNVLYFMIALTPRGICRCDVLPKSFPESTLVSTPQYLEPILPFEDLR